MELCQKCGNELTPESKFCAVCGTTTDQKTKKINYLKEASIIILMIGIALFVAGICIQTPSAELTTYSYADGSLIEEYVGGDAYNYIIGASLVGSKIAGTMISKTIYICFGILLICIGTLILLKNNTNTSNGYNLQLQEKQEDNKI